MIKVPNNIRAIAQKAIDYNLSLPVSKRAAYKDANGKRIQGTGMQTAKKLVNGAINEKQVRLMAAWFARHGKSEKEKQARKIKTSKASIAWALWGGSPARIWVNSVIRKLDSNK